MVVNNPKNWHWVEKNTFPWAKEYLINSLTSTKLTTPTYEITISEANVTGDCDVSQRKGKVICIYDMTLDLDVKGKKLDENDAEGSDFAGKLNISDFIHDEKDYEIQLKELGQFKSLVEKELLPAVLEVLYNFQSDLIKAHEKDVQE